jgi:CelD/BcsL family acetyltransferase involved in cellulose biosynthesis
MSASAPYQDPLPADRIEPLDSLEAARHDWEALAPATRNPFLTWEWAAAWWRAFGARRTLALYRVRDADGRVAAVLPLYRADRGPVPLLRFLGHGPADELGPVCAPERRDAVLALVPEIARRTLPRRGVVLLERLPAGSLAGAGIRGRVIREEPTPVLPVGGRSWDEWLGTRSRNLRAQIRSRERRITREHRLEFAVTEDPRRLASDFDTFLRLHEARWAAGADRSVAFAGSREAFHRDFAARALRRGWLRLWTALVDGEPVAAGYCLRFGGDDWYYQMGRDPAWDPFRVGFVLLTRMIRASFDDGAGSFRFGLGGEQYKGRFAEADPGLESVLTGAPSAVALVSAAVGALRGLPAGPRRVVTRRVA